jgi:hypothetical protein
MHVSYISLAFFTIGAIAAPAAPKPDSFGDITGGFPFNPTGSSTVEDSDDGFDNPFPAAMKAMEQAQAAKQSADATATPTHAAMAKPEAADIDAPPAVPAVPAVNAEPTHPAVHKPAPTHAAVAAPTSFPDPIVSQAPAISKAQAPVISQAPAPTPSHTATPTTSHAVIPSSKSGSATPSSSATPSPSAAAGPLGSLVEGVPLVGGLVGGPLAGLGLRR